MQTDAWKKTCKKIRSFLSGLTHFLVVSYAGSKSLVKRRFRKIYSASLEMMFGKKESKGRSAPGFQKALRSATLPLERSKHESAKKLLKHARKQYLDLSLAPYRMLHSSLHHSLKGYEMRNLSSVASYKKAHMQSERLHHMSEKEAPSENHEFVEYKAKDEDRPINYEQGKRDPHLWHNALDVGSCLEI